MPRVPQDVTDAELAILELLWERGHASVRQLAEGLYKRPTASQHATVQKLLERLEAKGCVRSDRTTWPHTFLPDIERTELIGRQLQQTANKLAGGSLQPLLTHLVRAAKLSDEDRQSLRALLYDLAQENRKADKK
jgi:BlaI family penicillinase repressor